MITDIDASKRALIRVGAAGAIVAGAFAGLPIPAEAKAERRGQGKIEEGEKVTPPEDLMREHGVLDRVLLIYEAALQKFERRQLVSSIHGFITMYRPHAAREDTELFPDLQKVVSPHEYDAMAEDFEKQEHKLFGEDGFEKMVQRVAGLERDIGINDFTQFTPR